MEEKTINLALLLFPIAIVPVSLLFLMFLGIPFSVEVGKAFPSPLFLLISVLTIIGFFINFGIVFPHAKKHKGALVSVLLWPAGFIVSGISLAFFTWNMLPFHLFVLPMLVAAAYNYYSFFRIPKTRGKSPRYFSRGKNARSFAAAKLTPHF